MFCRENLSATVFSIMLSSMASPCGVCITCVGVSLMSKGMHVWLSGGSKLHVEVKIVCPDWILLHVQYTLENGWMDYD